MQVNHKNGDKCDNRIENLEYCTPRENYLHALRTGLSKAQGETHYACKYTNEQVRAAVQLVRDGRSITAASKESGVSRDTIRDAIAGDHRKDLGLQDKSLRIELSRGERCHNAVLTEQQVLEIRRAGGGYAELARKYGVTPATVCDVLKGRTWKHLLPQEAVA
jgi:lambda repressor-like predicted transcriptional regulator